MILKKQKISWKDLEEANVDLTKINKLRTVDPEKFFQDRKKIGSALLECISENDTKAFIEILDQYIEVNKQNN